MRKFLVFLFVFIFLPSAVEVDSNVNSAHYGLERRIKTDKPMEVLKEEVAPKTVKDSIEEILSDWRTAEAFFYDANDSTQTRKDCDGSGAFGRKIESGSIALGSAFTKRLKEENMILLVEVKGYNLNVVTQYGKNIFCVNDAMGDRYNQSDSIFFVDFFPGDLDFYHIQKGKFPVDIKIHEIILPADTL